MKGFKVVIYISFPFPKLCLAQSMQPLAVTQQKIRFDNGESLALETWRSALLFLDARTEKFGSERVRQLEAIPIVTDSGRYQTAAGGAR